MQPSCVYAILRAVGDVWGFSAGWQAKKSKTRPTVAARDAVVVLCAAVRPFGRDELGRILLSQPDNRRAAARYQTDELFRARVKRAGARLGIELVP